MTASGGGGRGLGGHPGRQASKEPVRETDVRNGARSVFRYEAGAKELGTTKG